LSNTCPQRRRRQINQQVVSKIGKSFSYCNNLQIDSTASHFWKLAAEMRMRETDA